MGKAESVIRPAEASDWDEIQEIYAGARAFMKRAGNPTQWGDDYPSEELLRGDLRARQLYVLEEEGRLQGVFALVAGEDPTYREIDGAWLSDAPYLSLHRVASRGERRGVTAAFIDFSARRSTNLRIDTHPNNRPMQQAVERCGFQKCGMIRYLDGTPRIAYQRLTEEDP